MIDSVTLSWRMCCCVWRQQFGHFRSSYKSWMNLLERLDSDAAELVHRLDLLERCASIVDDLMSILWSHVMVQTDLWAHVQIVASLLTHWLVYGCVIASQSLSSIQTNSVYRIEPISTKQRNYYAKEDGSFQLLCNKAHTNSLSVFEP